MLAFFSVVATLFPLAGSAGAAFPGLNGRIAFSSNANDPYNQHIFVTEGTPQSVTRLTRGGNPSDDGPQIYDYNPSFSANGKKIVFARDTLTFSNNIGTNHWSIEVIRANGTHLRQLTSRAGEVDYEPDWQPSFSPNGKRIVFARQCGNCTSGIYVMSAHGAGRKRLTGNVSARWPFDATPSYSPSGKQITFTRSPDGLCGEIRVMRSDGSHQRGLHGAAGCFPTFSPNGKQIVFVNADPKTNKSAIIVMHADGSHQREVLLGGAWEGEPDGGADQLMQAGFSPNDKSIVFEKNVTAGQVFVPQIYEMQADGRDVAQITHNKWCYPTAPTNCSPANNLNPNWGPEPR